MGRITVASIVSSWIIPIFVLVNHIVPEPYMDEIFHVPQAQQYCLGNFKSWDPMITTPPGLYFFSLAYVASLFPGMLFIQPASYFINVCLTAVLRSTNGFLAVICSILVYDIIKSLKPSLDDRKATLYAVVLALYPLHCSEVLLYLYDKQILFGCYLLHEESFLSEPKDDYLASSRGVNFSSNLKRRRSGNAIAMASHFVHGTGLSSPFDRSSEGLFGEIWSILVASWHMKWELLVSFSPFFALLMAFAAFVVWNGSIVLGAKEAHTVSPHFTQLLYYSLVSCCFMAPVHYSTNQAANLAPSFWSKRPLSVLLTFLATMGSFFSVHYFSIAHPYLLADNRHYPFYLWRKIINAHWATRYLLVPLYVYSWTSILSMLAKAQKKVWVLVYFLASAAVLIPTPLIEFRYYTIAFFFLVLHSHVTDDWVWLLMGILYTSINIFTMIMFLFRPFHWDHEPGIQRFIW